MVLEVKWQPQTQTHIALKKTLSASVASKPSSSLTKRSSSQRTRCSWRNALSSFAHPPLSDSGTGGAGVGEAFSASKRCQAKKESGGKGGSTKEEEGKDALSEFGKKF